MAEINIITINESEILDTTDISSSTYFLAIQPEYDLNDETIIRMKKVALANLKTAEEYIPQPILA